jgi:RHS repeat-associated protein
LIAEYNGSNGLLSRYVHGPGSDEPLVWYEGASLTDRRFPLADERGSITAITNASGTVTSINAYDEEARPGRRSGGIQASTNLGRFGYTGQTWLPEIGMNYYKARIYSPTLGRFMQSDPIGYGDGINWYAYVGSDPVNGRDPSGLSAAPDPDADSLITVTAQTRGSLQFLSYSSTPGGILAAFSARSTFSFLSLIKPGLVNEPANFRRTAPRGSLTTPGVLTPQKTQPAPARNCTVSNTDSQKTGGIAGAFAYGTEFVKAGIARAGGATFAEITTEFIVGATTASIGTAAVAFVVVGGAVYAYDRYSGGKVTNLANQAYNKVFGTVGCSISGH